MSEFEIIKCKSCTAPLVQLQGQKLKKCIQCGHNFSQKANKKVQIESMMQQILAQQNNNSQNPQQGNQSSDQSQSSYSQTETETVNQPQNKIIPPKKPASIIGTIIKWYVILFIGSAFLKAFF
ncbi:MAG: hypothetical protein AB8B80_03850 [Marinicellaceae bacterium]